MQDKEFDKLFSSKLEGLEIEPSVKVWKGINGAISGNKRKKLIPVLSIAASIIVLIAAGVLFIPKKDSVVKIPVKKQLAANKPAKVKPAIIAKSQTVVAPQTSVIAVNKPGQVYHTNKTIMPMVTKKKELTAKNTTPVMANNTQVLAVNTSTKIDIKQPAIIDSSKALAAVQQSVKPAVIATVVPPVEKNTDVTPAKKHKIHGIGDLLNVAIAAVDKRKDKIIQFSDNDEDGTSITGVNLGVIKIKKEN